ncbi:alpha/beta hydrolase [Streptomyces hoynatensis]|uniref:Alpha/beta hydrolase n=1 Tax=Streptomyces hoynatensis TaxID=1141874 RepID=A0A3A9Z2R9_9ACTN|nr:alpha/beta hydrolase [Streptomyces hoynatensis]RKN42450.1 alpha/beta hydrolase [Streptomyces hoynatensis]
MRRRTTAALAASTLLGAGAAVAAATNAVRFRTLDAPAGFAGARLIVHGTTEGRITLTRSLDSLLPGTYAVTSRSARAVIGPVIEDAPRRSPDTVVRRLERVDQGELTPGSTVRLTPQLHRGDPHEALGIGYTDVRIPGERGELPAWFVPAPRDTWVIALHGLGSTREHPLNVLPLLHRLQFPVLLPDYPAEGLGAAEWPDADAAVRYAVSYGARRVVCYGWSVGGAMAMHAAARSPLRERIAGLVLDSPVLDPAATVRALAARRGVPWPLHSLAVRAARDGLRPGAGGPPAANLTRPGGSPVPVLVFHGPDDGIAPWDASRELAGRHPETTTLHTVAGAGHAAMWNADPEGYEEQLRRFLMPLM